MIEMEKSLKSPVVKVVKGKVPTQNLHSKYSNDLLLEDDPEIQDVRTDLGELDDLTQLYGEMGEDL